MPTDDRKLRIEEPGRFTTPGQASGNEIRVLLDNVRSRHNVGSIFRTSDAFGIAAIELCGLTPCPPHREIEKTALGATGTVRWEHHPETTARVRSLKELGFLVLAVEQTARALPLQQAGLYRERPIALVFGNELTGVSDAVIAECDQCLMIPQYGSKHSLNVSVCAGIVLWWLSGDRYFPTGNP
jgi:23S rRNA (guanosine2251-2'-O)-methyltransferase